MIKLSHLNKTYHHKGQRIVALKDVSLHVASGEIYGVVGQSGAGKSTLIRCVNLLERPDSGTVTVAGKTLTDMKPAELLRARHKMGMIFQHFNLLSGRNVFDNIALPLELTGTDKTRIKEKVRPLLALTGLEDKASHYPAQLSGGQKQRVAIARALAGEPQVLLSDEATSALDPKTTEDILKLLRDINEKLGLTILMITHEMEVVKQICHKVALIEGGQLVETADVDTFFTAPASTLGKQFVSQTQHFELPEIYLNRLQPEGDYPVIQLAFIGTDINEPVLSGLTKRFGIDVSIIQAKVEHIRNTNIGLIVAELIGAPTPVAKALEHLNTLPIQSEVLGYVSANH